MNGYWSRNKYHRLSVEGCLEEFCGWQPLRELIGYASQGRDQAFIATLFLTGGRVTEVLSLSTENFEMRMAEGILLVRGMRLVKRYKKLSETVDSEGHRHWITERLDKTRKVFPISLREPLTPILLGWISHQEGLLFPSPYRTGFPLSRFWAYKFIRSLDKTLPAELRQRLGLHKPFIKDGKK